MNSRRLFISLFCCGFFLVSCTKKPNSPSSQPSVKASQQGQLFYHEKLADDVLAQAGDLKILKSEVAWANIDPHKHVGLDALYAEREEILFYLFYSQHIHYAKPGSIQKVEYFRGPLRRKPAAILNQFGLLYNGKKIHFTAAPKGDAAIAAINDKPVSFADIKRDHFLYGHVETQLYFELRRFIYHRIKTQFLHREAKKQGIDTRQYIEKYAFHDGFKEPKAGAIARYRNQLNLPNTPEGHRKAKEKWLLDQGDRGVRFILENYVLPLPILLNFDRPRFFAENNLDMSPHNSAAESAVELTYFGGTHSEAEQKSSHLIQKALKMFPKKLRVVYRPLYGTKNKLQKLTVEALLCFWEKNQNQFWDYFDQIQGPHYGETEKVLVQKAAQFSVSDMGQCLVREKFSEVMKYHWDYGQYLSMVQGPVFYLNGLVFFGPVNQDQFLQSLREALGQKTAGLWTKDAIGD